MSDTVVWIVVALLASTGFALVVRALLPARRAPAILPAAIAATAEPVADSSLPSRNEQPRVIAFSPSLRVSIVQELDSGGDVTQVTKRFSKQDVQQWELGFLKDEEAIAVAYDDMDVRTMPFALILVTAVGRTDVGKRRKNNEDSYLLLEHHGVFAVADGMGGHAAGEVASALAMQTLHDAFTHDRYEGPSEPDMPRRGDELVRAIRTANRVIFARSETTPTERGMGTTLVAARFSATKKRVYIAHVGDSRCYRLRGPEFRQVTKDHTMAAFGVSGKHADKLTRSIGYESEVLVDLTVDAPEAGDRYLLCSDGLNKMVADDDVHALLRSETDVHRACAALIEHANARGGHDNVTVVLIEVTRPRLP